MATRLLCLLLAFWLLVPAPAWGILADGTLIGERGATGIADPTFGSFLPNDVGSDGAARFRVPIAVPPGTGGMQPELALSYSSFVSARRPPLAAGRRRRACGGVAIGWRGRGGA
jgi:hypothetical protein